MSGEHGDGQAVSLDAFSESESACDMLRHLVTSREEVMEKYANHPRAIPAVQLSEFSSQQLNSVPRPASVAVIRNSSASAASPPVA